MYYIGGLDIAQIITVYNKPPIALLFCWFREGVFAHVLIRYECVSDVSGACVYSHRLHIFCICPSNNNN